MTFKEKLIITAYTQINMVKWQDFHEFAEKLLDRPIMTHEFADSKLWDKIKAKVKDEFLNLCEKETHSEEIDLIINELKENNKQKKRNKDEEMC